MWDKIIWQNTIRDWGIALLMVLTIIVVLRIIQAVLILRIKRLAASTKTDLDDFIISVLQTSVMPAFYLISVYVGLHYLRLSPGVYSIMQIAGMLIVTFFILKILTSSVAYLFRRGMRKHHASDHRQNQARGILLIIQVIIWSIGLLFLIDNLGYDITTMVAGLGIGGIAIALAAQTILGDLFSYLVIYFDKPFEIGDFIIVDEKMGNVEYIGIKTTHIRTLSGEQLIFSNTDLTNSRLHNHKRMQERRVVFSIGIVYNTSQEKLRQVSGWIREIIDNRNGIRYDRAHFSSFGDFSLNFEIVYYVLSSDYNVYMDHQQALNLGIMEKFEEEEIDFAFPTQTLYMQRTPVEKPHNILRDQPRKSNGTKIEQLDQRSPTAL